MRVRRPSTKPASVWPIHRLADAAEGRIRVAVYRALQAARAEVSLADIERAYTGTTPDLLWASPGWQAMRNALYEAVRVVLAAEVRLLAADAFQRMPPVRKLDDGTVQAAGLFALVNERAVSWANREAAELVVQVDAETRAAIRLLILRMQRGHLTVAQAARELRQIVGLTTQQAQAVFNFRRQLEDRAGLIDLTAKERRALTDAQRAAVGRSLVDTQAKIEKAVDRYERRMRRYRATTIARTESMTAANRGQQEAWLAARDKGLLDPDVAQRWIITPDERLCPICEPMDGVTAPLGGLFSNPETSAQYSGPPAHPNCRCAVALEIKPPTLDAEGERLAAGISVRFLP